MAPARSKVEQLPAEIKKWLDEQLVTSGFSGYELLEEEVNARLEAAGADFKIGKSSIHRYGSDFEERLKSLRLVSEQAKAVVQASPDDEDAVSQALIRMTQERLFNVVMEMEVDPETVDLPKFAKAIADISRASISNKRYAKEVRDRAASVAEEAAATMKQAGLSAATANLIRQKILGIAA